MSGQEGDNGSPIPQRPTDTGDPDRLPSDGGPEARAREAVGGKLEEAAGRVRHLGDRAAARNRLLAPTRPLAYDAARSIENTAEYLRTREIKGMKTDLETQVRRHPLTAVVVAFLAGYALRRIFW